MNEETLKCVVSLIEPDIEKATIFTCDVSPDMHDFTLKTAIRKKMFTKPQAEKLREKAEAHRLEHGYKQPEVKEEP